jgi:hypothetical protein
MVDCHIEKMIAILRQKAQHEKELRTKTLVDYKQQLEKAMFQSADQYQNLQLSCGSI